MTRRILLTAVASIALLLGGGLTGVAQAETRPGPAVTLFPPRCC